MLSHGLENDELRWRNLTNEPRSVSEGGKCKNAMRATDVDNVACPPSPGELSKLALVSF
jgi:hypothetical protein